MIRQDALFVTDVSDVLMKLPPGAGAHPYCDAYDDAYACIASGSVSNRSASSMEGVVT